MFIAIAAPDGGLGGFPALVQGEDGATPEIDLTINNTVLSYTDPTPDSMSWTETSDNVYRLNATQRTGPQGVAGPITMLDADDVTGTMTPGYGLVVNPAADGFVTAAPKVGDEYWPATISSTPSGNAAYTLCSVSVPAQAFDWRPAVSGQCVVTGTGSDVRVDLVARLNDAAAGNIVGRAIGGTEMLILATGGLLATTNHVHPTHMLVSGPPTGSASTYNKVNAGDAAVIYLRAERQAGANTFTTSGTTTTFKVRVEPIP